ncbi:hypothetical protein AWM75_00405 [Aerococcus urinaehominis]|uniref:Uncharacterized protein n=1 Tax=Aerococcus urinaehominis TaxID=128944 RepID=A0A109RGC5_9LACT|nr:CorA family divalent cation transporter [Aerococcus urinaehominis]AMB98544.1 hypothetical protein AWM75_00405 [Aerococcus urinaehominis]SDL78682.1 CorA-like Mg2+ transporter protein [Aerococcus urinaehominis]
MIDKLTDVFTNVLNNNMNTIMKILTSWSILLTIPTIIAGIWGMNVDLPFTESDWAFIVLSVLTAGMIIGVYIYLKRKKML